MKSKEHAKLLRQVAKVIETEEPAASAAKHIIIVDLVQGSDVTAFTQDVKKRIADIEKIYKAEVSVEYSTTIASTISSTGAGQMLIHSAMLIGRV